MCLVVCPDSFCPMVSISMQCVIIHPQRMAQPSPFSFLYFISDVVDTYRLAKCACWSIGSLRILKIRLLIKKTQIILFKTRQKRYMKHLIESTQFLGINIDSGLTWKQHINYIKGKNIENKWYIYINTKDSIIPQFIHIFITEILYGEIRTRLDWNNESIALFAFRYLNNMLPKIFNNFFILNRNLRNHNTRSSSNIHFLLDLFFSASLELEKNYKYCRELS